MYAILAIPASGKKARGKGGWYNRGMPWDVIGHEWAVGLLRKEIVRGRPAHAYLFTGAEGIGKRTLALQFAKAVNCENPPAPGDACGDCRTCRLIETEKHPDLFVLRPEENGGRILVDSARDLILALMLKPLEARRRIALLADFQRALPGTANALLKTLEEPPPSALLLLTADSADELLPTIVSRCRVLALRPLSEQMVSRALEERWRTDTGTAALLARLSGGRLGWAVRQLQMEDWRSEREAVFRQWSQILHGSRAERFSLARKLAGDRDQVRSILQMWQSFGHDLLLRSFSPETEISNMDFLPALQDQAKRIRPEAARLWLAALHRVEEQVERNANLRLALEAAFLDAPKE
jgi:DNA polymerase III subunit delta'